MLIIVIIIIIVIVIIIIIIIIIIIVNLLQSLERAISDALIPSLIGRNCSKAERDLVALPVRMGGLGPIW